MFWELYQHRLIGQADGKARRAMNQADKSLVYLERLEGRVATLALACQSLWELLRDNTDLTEEELESKMEEIDLRDGRLDGKITPSAEKCAKCGRKTTRRRSNCLYCGAPTSEGELFGRH